MYMSNENVAEVVMGATDWAAIAVGFVVAFFLSFLWWGPLMGKKWAKEMGMEMDEAPPMAKPLILQAVGTLFFSYVMWHVVYAFSTVSAHDGSGSLEVVAPEWAGAMMGAVMLWFGFFVPAHLGRVAWEKATWNLAGINLGGHLITLLAMATTFKLM